MQYEGCISTRGLRGTRYNSIERRCRMCSFQLMSKFNSVAPVIGDLPSRNVRYDHNMIEHLPVRVNAGAFPWSSIGLSEMQ